MSSTPRLSIGMPVFNGERWIEEALESLLTQSFSDFELIIGDNASTDATRSICEQAEARDTRIRYVRNPENIGVLRNYNRVFELARGEYFKWASCSDICLDGFLEQCVAVLEQRPDVVLAYPRAILILSPAGQEEVAEEYDDDLDLQQEEPSVRYREYLNRERINNVMNGVIRSSALRQTALNYPVPGSDISMVAELTLRGKFVEVPDRLFVRRLNPQTTGILMGTNAARAALGYPGDPTNLQRIRLHSYRFVSALKAPISAREKARVWLYLLRRVAWLRHRALDKVLRLATGRR